MVNRDFSELMPHLPADHTVYIINIEDRPLLWIGEKGAL